MTEDITGVPAGELAPGIDQAEFASQVAAQIESFLIALREIAREGNGSQAVSLLLLEISQVLLAGARLGAQMGQEVG